MDDVSVIIREWNPYDVPFIYSTWRNALWYGGTYYKDNEDAAADFFQSQTWVIDEILKNPIEVSVAVLNDSPDVIIGYSVFDKYHLYFIYVKEAFRKQGIGKLLFPNSIKTVSEPRTKIGEAIVAKKGLTIG
jgi:ribosomal protein S18 acetylase RimI-like enzyme